MRFSNTDSAATDYGRAERLIVNVTGVAIYALPTTHGRMFPSESKGRWLISSGMS